MAAGESFFFVFCFVLFCFFNLASLVAQLVESTCNAGDTSSISGLGRSPGEGIDYSFQYSWASLVTQTVKTLSEMQETWVQFLGWENPLEESMTTHTSILAWRIPTDKGSWQATIHGVANSLTQLRD